MADGLATAGCPKIIKNLENLRNEMVWAVLSYQKPGNLKRSNGAG